VRVVVLSASGSVRSPVRIQAMSRATLLCVLVSACAPSPGTTVGPLSVEPEFIDLGSVPAGSHSLRFRLINHTRDAIRCLSVQSSCACAVAKGRDGFVIDAGESYLVDASLFLEPGQSRIATFIFKYAACGATWQLAAHIKAEGKPRDDLVWDAHPALGTVIPGVPARHRLTIRMAKAFAASCSEAGTLPQIDWRLYHGAALRVVGHGIDADSDYLRAWADLEVNCTWVGRAEDRVIATIGPLPGIQAVFYVSWVAAFPVPVDPPVLVLQPSHKGLHGTLRMKLDAEQSITSCALAGADGSTRSNVDAQGWTVVDVETAANVGTTRLCVVVAGRSGEVMFHIPVAAPP